ncbi:MAG: CapA family protein [Acidobacteriota bacterium]
MFTRRAFLPLLAAAPAFAQSPLDAGPLEAGPLEASPLEAGWITRVILGGDVMLSRNVAARARAAKDPASPFRDIAPVFADADIAFANLESPFSDQGPVMQRGMIFKTEPEMIAGLQLAGIDVVSTANNHARDRGSYGLEFTLDLLARNNIAAAGTGKTAEAAHAGAVLERNGIRFGFLAYTYDANNGNHKDTDPRVAILDTEEMVRDVASIKTRADVVIVSMHAGIEYQPNPSPAQAEFAHAAINAGAQVVVGHHPHVRQPWEWYAGGVIFYSLGNLIFDQFQRTETQIGSLAEVVFRDDRLIQARVHTVNLVGTIPRLAEPVIRPSASTSPAPPKP